MGNVLLLLAAASGWAVVLPPSQPASGPGGEPADPVPSSAPLVIFLHGWGAMEPRSYSDWIAHIARKGNIVVYPRYQADLRTPTAQFTQNAMAAIATLRGGSHVQPELNRVAIVATCRRQGPS